LPAILTAYQLNEQPAVLLMSLLLLLLLQDLTGGNVLLTTFAGNPHGFSAKVTDFGLARPQDVRVRSAPGRYGTVTHMAPETIRAGVLDYPCDAYAFGVLCWEMITGG
jgi:serine/threonine protein kinase